MRAGLPVRAPGGSTGQRREPSSVSERRGVRVRASGVCVFRAGSGGPQQSPLSPCQTYKPPPDTGKLIHVIHCSAHLHTYVYFLPISGGNRASSCLISNKGAPSGR